MIKSFIGCLEGIYPDSFFLYTLRIYNHTKEPIRGIFHRIFGRNHHLHLPLFASHATHLPILLCRQRYHCSGGQDLIRKNPPQCLGLCVGLYPCLCAYGSLGRNPWWPLAPSPNHSEPCYWCHRGIFWLKFLRYAENKSF